MRTPLTWVFDVDGCIVDSLTGTSLRPGARQLLTHLRHQNQLVLVWSAGGADYARRRAHQHDIAELVHSFHSKDQRDGEGRYRIDHFLEDVDHVVFVDDQPEELPTQAQTVGVRPYLAANEHDAGLQVVASIIGLDVVEKR